ncbi:MAG: hypothetical protein FWE97_04525 [Dehalococcoidia bacterium]|nr:hypothetical protein [Dehalococcoidia bacterium]
MKETKNVKPQQNSEAFAIASFICAVIPHILYALTSIISIFDNRAFGIIYVIYFSPLVLYSVAIASVFLGIKGLKSEARIFSYVALALTLIPVIWVLLCFVATLIY